ncbi:MAG: Dabb family protein [Candidatus Dormibacteraeota bacterium]|uniref:Dabb family protein n=1 Tax=Candidatus Amunia macphersoniae TaxID=3127014 RepID=A0A934N9K7_9BACT|nr:Dabb family protein [Candidatus Dormibacteraeota bacterium]
MTLQHVVLFSFPQELSTQDAADMKAQVASWPSQIGCMTQLRFGADLTGARTNGYSRLLYMEFAGTAELERYRQHPVHQAFNRWIVERQCTPLAFDYFLDPDTALMPQASHREEEERR